MQYTAIQAKTGDLSSGEYMNKLFCDNAHIIAVQSHTSIKLNWKS